MHCNPLREHHELMQRATLNLAALTAAAPRLRAADALELRLREVGIPANAACLPHDHGYAVMIYVTAPKAHVLAWLEHFAIPVESVSTNLKLNIHAYQVTVSGVNISLVITDMPS